MFLLKGDGDDIVAAFIGLGVGVFGFFRGFRHLRNKRLIENTPTSKCRSVAMGMVEVCGAAQGTTTLPSLIGRIPCFCSQIKIERYEKRGKSSSWRTIHTRTESISFFVEDNTGRIRVDPENAELDVPPELEYATDSGLARLLGLTLSRLNSAKVSSNDIPALFSSYCASRGISFHGRMRFTERNICPGDPVYVLGSAEEIAGVQDEHERIVIRKGRHHPWFFISEGSEKEALSKLRLSIGLHVFGGTALALACLAYLLYKFGMWN